MSAPTQNPPGARRRPWGAGLAVGLAVLAVALLTLAFVPRATTATASLSVTPRTEAGADAALLLADRYAALVGAVTTLRAAREAEPALAGVPLDELCDTLLTRLVPGSGEDDVALVAVRAHPEDRPRPAEAGPNRLPPGVD